MSRRPRASPHQQVETRRSTIFAITGHRDFLQGVLDYQAGRGFPSHDWSWTYERGRLYAAACAGRGIEPNMCQRIGRERNLGLIFDYKKLRDKGDIL